MPNGDPIFIGAQNVGSPDGNKTTLETQFSEANRDQVALSVSMQVTDGHPPYYGTGVLVVAQGTGVQGWGNPGVWGSTPPDRLGEGPTIGVLGQNPEGTAVVADAWPDGDGVSADTDSGTAARAFAQTGYGLVAAGHVGAQTSNLQRDALISSGGIPLYAHKHYAYLSTDCCAGDFYGPVYVHGDLTYTGALTMQIDHPSYPGDRFLSHSVVASSDMKNIYDGVAELDDSGTAIVSCPDWIEALNSEFRYQLTAIGEASPDLHVARELEDNEFQIAGGRPGQKVSWMVTGIRRDAWASKHPMEPDQEKVGAEAGAYSHPELYGGTVDQSMRVRRYPDSDAHTKQPSLLVRDRHARDPRE